MACLSSTHELLHPYYALHALVFVCLWLWDTLQTRSVQIGRASCQLCSDGGKRALHFCTWTCTCAVPAYVLALTQLAGPPGGDYTHRVRIVGHARFIQKLRCTCTYRSQENESVFRLYSHEQFEYWEGAGVGDSKRNVFSIALTLRAYRCSRRVPVASQTAAHAVPVLDTLCEKMACPTRSTCKYTTST